ncbi:MAG: hemolysin family protein [Bacteroidales bacterium]|nr:hemolysin family protein [Bacteroidales bacterium]
MTLTTWLILAIVSLIFSALFSGMEIAYVTSDRVRVELDVNNGGLLGKIINRFYSDPDFFISSILVGNNVVLVIYGMGAAALLDPWIETWCHNQALLLIISTLISTAVILLMGEFVPKTIFRINPNKSLRLFAWPVYIIYLLIYPISLFTTWLSKSLMKLCGIKSSAATLGMLSLGDLNQYLERTIDEVNPEKAPVENEVKIFHNALDFSSTHLRDCMQPRNEIVAVDIEETTREQLSRLFTTSGRSKIVVYREDIDNVLGYIHVSELFVPDKDWTQCLKSVIFAPETLLANKLMKRLLAEKRSMAIVVDEFGGTAGLVTLEDLVEEIFGDIQDEHDTTSTMVKALDDGVYECAGRCEIEMLRESYHIDIPEDDAYQTLAGYILHNVGAIPAQGEVIEIADLTFTIVKRTSTRLELIRVAPVKE